MLEKITRIFILAALLSGISLVNAGVSQAADIVAAGPNEAIAPSPDWVELAPGQEVWYVFDYDFDDSRDTISEAIVELEMGTEDSVGFEIWTPEQVHKWAEDKDFDPIGVGAVKSNFTLNDDHDTKLIWANRAPASERFYVIVANELDVASYYSMDIAGTGVSFPTTPQIAAPAMMAEADATATDEVLTEALGIEVEGAVAETPVMGGVGPDTARVPSDEWVELVPGQEIWYVFDYDFDDSRDTISEAIVELEMGTEDSVGFEVWTPEQVRKWAEDEDFDPIGAGAVKSDFTLNDDHDTKLIWANRAPASERFYIIVENELDVASYYTLDIGGTGVSFPTMDSSPMDSSPMDSSPAADEVVVSDTASGDEVLTESLGIEVEGVAVETPAMAGNSPDTALAASGAWVGIEPGQKVWYTFNYDYDQHASSISEALVRLEMGSEDSVSFEVWTPEQVRKWINDDDFDPTGAGAVLSNFTLNDDHDTKLIWSSRTPVSETYFVIVENEHDTTSYYALETIGKNVSY